MTAFIRCDSAFGRLWMGHECVGGREEVKVLEVGPESRSPAGRPASEENASHCVRSRLSVCRENPSDRWETDLIMLSFFQFPFSGRFVLGLSSFEPQRFISPQTRSPLASAQLAHPLSLWHLHSSRSALFVYVLNQNQLSSHSKLGRWIRTTDDALWYLFRGPDWGETALSVDRTSSPSSSLHPSV